MQLTQLHLTEEAAKIHVFYVDVTIGPDRRSQPITIDQILAELFPPSTPEITDDDVFDGTGNSYALVISACRMEPKYNDIALLHFAVHPETGGLYFWFGSGNYLAKPPKLEDYCWNLYQAYLSIMYQYKDKPLDVTLTRQLLEHGLKVIEDEIRKQ